ITMSKESFIKLRGYDESLQGYGYEDLDIMNRAMANGLRLLPATLQKGGVIKHRSWERAQNMTNKNIHKTNLNNMEKCWSRCPWEIINPNGFGKATVYENFSAEPIEVGYKKNSIPTQNVPVSAIILYVGDRRLPAERKTIPSVMRNFPRETTMVKWDGAITMQALKTHIRRSMQPYILTCLGGTIFMPGSLHKMVAALEANPKEIYAYPTIRYIGCEPPHIPVAVLIRREACMNMSDGSKMNGVTVDEAVVEFLGL
ncbi:MAG: galactosyltransferase-related protein, partial [Nitrososphaerales archaeon]